MSDATSSSLSACPACSAAPMAEAVARRNTGGGETVLSLPHIHCAGCIRGVENALLAIPGVKGARVNLSRKRVSVDAGPVEPEALVEALDEAGYEAMVLDEDCSQHKISPRVISLHVILVIYCYNHPD